MKIQTSIIAAAILAVSAGLCVAEENEKEGNSSKIPAAVQDAFKKAYPQAKNPEYERKTKTVFEVEFKDQGREIEALYTADGVLIQTEIEIAVDTLPEAIKAAITKAYPKAALKEAEKLTRADGSVIYKVEVKDGQSETEVELDDGGKILSAETESEQED